jgi:plasmid replication initiation protein
MSKFKEIKVTGTEVVVQNNKLVESPKFITLQEQRLFIFLISKLNPNNPADTTFRIPIDEFAKAIGGDIDNAYSSVRSIVKKLSSNIITIKGFEDGCKTTMDIPLLGYAKYWHGKGYADIKISDEIAPYLFDLKDRYTSYKLTQITRLSSIYAIRIYELLKQYENLKKRSFFIDDLRKTLAIKEIQYKRFNDFRKYVLDIAKKEINEKTDLKIDYELKKTGKKFTVINFSIVPKDEKKQFDVYEIPRYYDQSIVDKMVSLGMKEQTAKEWFEKYSPIDIENAIKVVEQNLESGQCDSSVAMLKTAIQKHWKPKIKSSDIESMTFKEVSYFDGKNLQKTESNNPVTSEKKKPHRKSSITVLQKLFSIFDN